MLRKIKIWSAVFAITIASLKTISEIIRDHPITHATDTYLLLIWFCSGFLFPQLATRLLLSGWAIATGYLYAAFTGVLVIPGAPTFVKVYYGIITTISIISLFISNHIFKAVQNDIHEQQGPLLYKIIRFGGILMGVVLILALAFNLRKDQHALFMITHSGTSDMEFFP